MSLEGLSVLGGLRHVLAEQDFELQGAGAPGQQHSNSNSSSQTDVMLGARYVKRMSDHWEWGVRGDYATGDTDGTWNLLALVGRQFQKGVQRLPGSERLYGQILTWGA